MEDKPLTIKEFSIIAFIPPWTGRISSLLLLIAQILLIIPNICQGSEIIVRLSGEIDYPGDLSILSNTIEIKKILFESNFISVEVFNDLNGDERISTALKP